MQREFLSFITKALNLNMIFVNLPSFLTSFSIYKILVDKTETPTALSLLEEIEEDRLLAEGGIFPIGKLQFHSAMKNDPEKEFYLLPNLVSFCSRIEL